MCISIIKILNNAFRPLKAFLAKRTTTVQSHNDSQVIKFLPLFRAHLIKSTNTTLKNPKSFSLNFLFLVLKSMQYLSNILGASNTQLVSVLVIEQHIRQQGNDIHRESEALRRIHNRQVQKWCQL